MSPTLDILRVPEWGRAAETFGEDPHLVSQMGSAEISGIQSDHVIATANMFPTIDQDTNRIGPGAFSLGTSVDARVSVRALNEIYYPAFRAAAQGGVGAFMCAYSQLNGAYGCQNATSLSGALESAWGFTGFVMTDWFAQHSTVASARSGLDLEMPDSTYYGSTLEAAVKTGEVSQATLDDMVRRILTSMFRIGLFDHPTVGDPSAIVTSAIRQALARQIAEQGSVLLKNDHGILPLSAKVHSVAVIGDDAGPDAQYSIEGSGVVSASGLVTPVAGIMSRAGPSVVVKYTQGTRGPGPLPLLSGTGLVPPSGSGAGLLATYYASTNLTGPPVTARVRRASTCTACRPPDSPPSGPPVGPAASCRRPAGAISSRSTAPVQHV